MPNWCECEMTVTGPSGELDRFMAGIKQEDAKPGEDTSGERPYLLLESYVPMPEALRDTISPARVFETEAERDEYNAAHTQAWGDGTREHAITRAESDRLKSQYGANNWYDWQHAYWGVKWGDCRATLERTGPRRVFLRFETPWSPPIAGMDAVAAKFPTLAFRLRYWECGCGFKGDARWSAGEQEYDRTEKYYGRRGG